MENENEKRGRRLKENAKRVTMTLRLSEDEAELLRETARLTGKTRTAVILDGARRQYADAMIAARRKEEADKDKDK